MTLMKDPERSGMQGEAEPLEEPAEIVLTSWDLLRMHPMNSEAEPVVYEIQGPPTSYVDLPLDWFTDEKGFLEPAQSAGAVRLTQRLLYRNFVMVGPTAEDVHNRAIEVMDTVRGELKRLHEVSFIWWRLYPKYEIEALPTHDEDGIPVKPRPARHKVRMRLGSMPGLSSRFWLELFKRVENISSEPLVPRG